MTEIMKPLNSQEKTSKKYLAIHKLIKMLFISKNHKNEDQMMIYTERLSNYDINILKEVIFEMIDKWKQKYSVKVPEIAEIIESIEYKQERLKDKKLAEIKKIPEYTSPESMANLDKFKKQRFDKFIKSLEQLEAFKNNRYLELMVETIKIEKPSRAEIYRKDWHN